MFIDLLLSGHEVVQELLLQTTLHSAGHITSCKSHNILHTTLNSAWTHYILQTKLYSAGHLTSCKSHNILQTTLHSADHITFCRSHYILQVT